MSDDRLREIERTWQATLSLDEECGLVRERLRAGLVRHEDVVAAAALGHEAARRVLDDPPAPATAEELLPLLLSARRDWVLVTGDLLALALSFALDAAVVWSATYGGGGADRAVRALQACLRCPCALYADASRLAAACLRAPWVGGRPVENGAETARDASFVLNAASRMAESHARAVLGESPELRTISFDLQLLLDRAETLVGVERRHDLTRTCVGSRLLGLEREPVPSTSTTVTEPPERPPIDGVLASLQTDLLWARERLATFLTVRATDPTQAEEELRYLTGDLRDASEAVAEILHLVATWDELKRRSDGTQDS